jgi:prephenate dehydrogenase
MSQKRVERITLIGLGEVGGIFGRDFAAAEFDVAITDVLLSAEPSRQAMLEKAGKAGVRACDSLEEAIRNADLIIIAVTAAAAIDTAREAALYLGPR